MYVNQLRSFTLRGPYRRLEPQGCQGVLDSPLHGNRIEPQDDGRRLIRLPAIVGRGHVVARTCDVGRPRHASDWREHEPGWVRRRESGDQAFLRPFLLIEIRQAHGQALPEPWALSAQTKKLPTAPGLERASTIRRPTGHRTTVPPPAYAFAYRRAVQRSRAPRVGLREELPRSGGGVRIAQPSTSTLCPLLKTGIRDARPYIAINSVRDSGTFPSHSLWRCRSASGRGSQRRGQISSLARATHCQTRASIRILPCELQPGQRRTVGALRRDLDPGLLHGSAAMGARKTGSRWSLCCILLGALVLGVGGGRLPRRKGESPLDARCSITLARWSSLRNMSLSDEIAYHRLASFTRRGRVSLSHHFRAQQYQMQSVVLIHTVA
jgi:hypothetical protein